MSFQQMNASIPSFGVDDLNFDIIEEILNSIVAALVEEFPPLESVSSPFDATVDYGGGRFSLVINDHNPKLNLWIMCSKSAAAEYDGEMVFLQERNPLVVYTRLDLRTEGAVKWAVGEMLQLMRIVDTQELMKMFE